jgi:hypothetical protein
VILFEVIVMTDTQIHTHTHTDIRTPFFYCFIVFRDLNNVQKNHKKWVYKFFIFCMNSILRHSNASRSNKISITPLFMTFLDVIEVPQHDKAVKNSVCLDCHSFCVLVCMCVSVSTITPLFHYATEVAMVPKTLLFLAVFEIFQLFYYFCRLLST